MKAIDDAISLVSRNSLSERKQKLIDSKDIGNKCLRYIWLRHLWALSERRLTDEKSRSKKRTIDYEALIIADLREAGYAIVDRDEKGDRITYRNKLLSTEVSGIISIKNFESILQIIPMRNRNYRKLVKDGLQDTYNSMYVSCQISMGLSKLRSCLFVSQNKDTSEVHSEVIQYDKTLFEFMNKRAEAVKGGDNSHISKSRTFFKCKMCKLKSVCKGDDFPEVSCRSCVRVVIGNSGKISCSLTTKKVPERIKIKGCKKHLYNPEMLEGFATPEKTSEQGIEYRTDLGGLFFENVTHSSDSFQYAYSSKELMKMGKVELADKILAEKEKSGE